MEQMDDVSAWVGSVFQLPDLVELSEGISPLSAKNAVLSWLRSQKNGGMPSPRGLASAELECTSKNELCYVFHVEAVLLFFLGDTSAAIDKATKCLDLASRIGHKQLEAQALLHLGRIYEALGHNQLGAEYIDAATRTVEGRLSFS